MEPLVAGVATDYLLTLQQFALALFLLLSLFLMLRFFVGNGFIFFKVKQDDR